VQVSILCLQVPERTQMQSERHWTKDWNRFRKMDSCVH